MEFFLDYFRIHYGVHTLADITWIEAVNNQNRLQTALKSAGESMIIDADITKSADGVAMCAHWPDTTSDLSFSELIENMKSTKQGLKLDFKDGVIVNECLQILQKAELSQPVI